MQENFAFYANLSNHLFTHIGDNLEQDGLNQFLQTDVRAKLFDEAFCLQLEETKKRFLSEIIKLEQFLQSKEYKISYLNDLESLKAVANSIYELLGRHWDLYRYESNSLTSQKIISFLLEIDSIAIGWDSYLEKYLTVSKMLKETGYAPQKPGFLPIKVKYHLPQGVSYNLGTNLKFSQFLLIAYEFVLTVHGETDLEQVPEVLNLEASNYLSMVLWVPGNLAPSFSKLLGYLSIDVIKRETLVKYVMEVIAAGEGKELAKNVVSGYQKKLAKQLESLPEDGYLSIDENEMTDSVDLLATLVKELERIPTQYKDLLAATAKRLGRNKVISGAAFKAQPTTGQPTTAASPQTETQQVTAQAATSAPSPEKTENEKPKAESTVKVDISSKEHHGFLTS